MKLVAGEGWGAAVVVGGAVELAGGCGGGAFLGGGAGGLVIGA